MKKVVIFWVLLSIPGIGFSQNFTHGTPGQTALSVKILEVFTGDVIDGSYEYRWKIRINDGSSECLKTSGSPGWHININKFLSDGYGISAANITLGYEMWEEDCGSDCYYNECCDRFLGICLSNDDYHCGPVNVPLNITTKVPGTYHSDLHTICQNRQIGFEFQYLPPVPSTPEVYVDGALYSDIIRCVNSPITLQANSFLSNAIKPQVTYTWYYRVNNEFKTVQVPNPNACPGHICCNNWQCFDGNPNNGEAPPGWDGSCCNLPPTTPQQEPRWRIAGTTTAENDGTLSFYPFDLDGVPTGQNSEIVFTVVASANGSKSWASPLSTIVQVSPAAPYASMDDVTTTTACQNFNNGSITINNIRGGTHEKSYIATPLGQPDGPTQTFTGGTANITGLSPGNYTVEIFNANGSAACPLQLNNIIVGTTPNPVIQNLTITEVNCPGNTDARITFNTSGGMTNTNMNFSLSPAAGTFVRTSPTSGYFENLPPNVYTLTAFNPLPGNLTCGTPAKENNILIPEVTLVSIQQFSASPPTCVSSPNGTTTFNTTGGSGLYNYRIFNPSGTLVREQLNASSSWTFGDLPQGTYYGSVSDAIRESCSFKKTQNFSFTPATPLALDITKKDIACFGQHNGQLTLTATGGSGQYQFNLLNQSTHQSYINTDGVLSNLPPGPYQITLTNQDSCLDEIIDQVTLDEPPAVIFAVTATPITCRDDDNGSLQALVSGGSGQLHYQWQFNDGNGWTDLPGNSQGNFVDHLFDATYRLVVEDENHCLTYSPEQIMENPFPIEWGTLQTVPETCLGAQDATIQFQGIGGWAPLVHEISFDGGQQFVPHTSMGLPSGQYIIRLRDAEGCTLTEDITLDAPPEFDVNFLSASTLHVGDTLLLIEVSFPIPDKIDWTFAPGYIDYNHNPDFPLIGYTEPGNYSITLTAHKGQCSHSVTKTITYLPAEQKPAGGGRLTSSPVGIANVIVYPNPTQGQMEVKVTLDQPMPLGVFVYTLQGNEIYRNLLPANSSHDFSIDLSGHEKGVYILKLATERALQKVKVMVE